MTQEAPKSPTKLICQNKKARFDYSIIETYEAGIALTGPEIKSVKLGGISLNESYIAPKDGELFLVGAHIKPYSFSSEQKYDPLRKRKLLMHKNEIQRLSARVAQKGLTLIPLQVHLKRGYAKLEVALAKGKAAPDKRDSIKKRESDREIKRAMSRKKA